MLRDRYQEVYGEYRNERIVQNRSANKPADINSRVKTLQKLLACQAYVHHLGQGLGGGKVTTSLELLGDAMMTSFNQYCDQLFPALMIGDNERVRDDLIAQLQLDISDLTGVNRARMGFTCTRFLKKILTHHSCY